MSEPRVSLRSVEAWRREFASDEVNPLSHMAVAQARAAFGQLLLKFTKEGMTSNTGGITHGFVLGRHLHDEAAMRFAITASASSSIREWGCGRFNG